ncbi:MAG: 50S ribosomal protein L18 [Candidatus Schekmanbacteria bacterium RBG_13_48_7]|uniref:Large ribosomal subunit protein uL18 n=1 Tax=Candidatus Schekmanbacteria bacterium RBG_13_48_7 TaxID=1817878 RepID=A0A1F7S1T3_9BACT|nr:ribosomal protein L18 [uncultured bacterium]OGL47739.1 MAG: 50S ribosomal protein L18 [Candidatus Schekmanbacteria bacterium RBG_13_48_7]
MTSSVEKRLKGKDKRHRSIRRKIRGSAERPRLSIYKSLKNIYIQLIDDERGCTLSSASTLSPEFKAVLKTGANKTAAKKIGEIIAEKALAKEINKIVFDRSGYLYHGCIKIIADTLREKGIIF